MNDTDNMPPAETPWLISHCKQLRASAANVMKWKQRWRNDFPGVHATHDEKNAWARKIEVDSRDFLALLDESRPNDPTAILRSILYEHANNEVEVQLITVRSMLKDLHMPFRRPTNIYGERSSEFALIAQVRKPKNARTQDVLDEILMAAGLSVSSYIRCAPANGGLATEADINYHLPELLGETLPFGGARTVVAFEVLRPGDKETTFERDCRLRAQADAHRGQGFLFVRRVDVAGTSDYVTEKTHRVLWFSHEEEVDRVRRHLRWGEGETEEVKIKLDQWGPDAGKIFLDMLVAEFEYAKNLKGWPRKLSALLGLTLEVFNDPRFLRDSVSPKSATSLILEIATYWRTCLLKVQASNLGLGIPGEGGSFGPAQSMDALIQLLRLVKSQLETITVENGDETNVQEIRVKFPAVPRIVVKKRASATTTKKKSQPGSTMKTQRPTAVVATINGESSSFPRPSGRAPADKTGAAMLWSSERGVWYSKSDPNEIKARGQKRMRLST